MRSGDDEAISRLARQVGDACERIGFIYVVNHGIPRAVIAEAFVHARQFFGAPEQTKTRLAYNSIQRGYKAQGTITIPGHPPDRKEVFDMGVDLSTDHAYVREGRALHGPNQWPPDPAFRGAMQAYFSQVSSLGHSLLPVFATALGLEPAFFDPFHRNPFITWRIMRYPPGTGTPGQYGTAPHTDFGTLTLLAQDSSGGLQLCLRDGEWVNAPVVADSFIVNIGDLMACWTNDRFTSTPHRVINSSGNDRYSIPMFFNPSFDTVAQCLPTCQDEENPPRYQPIHYGDYVTQIYGRIFAPVEK
jgi:isopenicillin N synthase-like dioxygenase